MNWNRPIFPLRCTFALASALIVTNLPAAVLYVKEDAGEGGEGTSWADAMYSLQEPCFIPSQVMRLGDCWHIIQTMETQF